MMEERDINKMIESFKPKPKTYFNKRGYRWNEDACQLADEAQKLVRNLFEREMAKGYSPREIAYIIAQEAYTISLDRVLDIKNLEELQDLSDQE